MPLENQCNDREEHCNSFVTQMICSYYMSAPVMRIETLVCSIFLGAVCNGMNATIINVHTVYTYTSIAAPHIHLTRALTSKIERNSAISGAGCEDDVHHNPS